MNNVQNGGGVVNAVVTSREQILGTCRELIRRQGWPAVQIRAVAAACGVSVGSIYNYFGSKAELVAAAVESVWQDIFCCAEREAPGDILSCLTWLYGRMEYGGRTYPGFFSLHAVSFLEEDRADGKRRMERAWGQLQIELESALRRDPWVRPDAFDQAFTPEQFAGTLFSLMLSALVREDYDPAPVLELSRRLLY
nr:TetR/AcrR family transcriptional regulator [uncultured Dysosmobacter sp.]